MQVEKNRTRKSNCLILPILASFDYRPNLVAPIIECVASAAHSNKIRERAMVQKTKMEKALSIKSSLIVATAIATLGLGSPAFALGGWDNDTGNLQPSYYDKNDWHMGRLPQQAFTRQPAWPGRGLYLYVPGANGPVASGPGGMSNEMLQNDWWRGGANPGH